MDMVKFCAECQEYTFENVCPYCCNPVEDYDDYCDSVISLDNGDEFDDIMGWSLSKTIK